jgi:hypothetical protein
MLRARERSQPVAVELVGDGPLDLRSRGDRLARHGIDVLDVHVQADRRAAVVRRAVRVEVRMNVGEHDDSVTDPYFGMADLPGPGQRSVAPAVRGYPAAVHAS